MTQPDLSNKFGVKFINDDGQDVQVNQYFDDSNDAAAHARGIYSQHPNYRDVRVVSAVELSPWDAAPAKKSAPKAENA